MKLRNSNLIEQDRINIKEFAKNFLNINNEILSSIKEREIVD